jgi:hypothetical protein
VRGISDLTRHLQGRNGVGCTRSPVVNTHFNAQDMLGVLAIQRMAWSTWA